MNQLAEPLAPIVPLSNARVQYVYSGSAAGQTAVVTAFSLPSTADI